MTTSSRSADVSPLASEDRATPFDRSAPFPTPLRPGADLAVLDVTKYFGDRTGGIRTYLLEKARYVAAHPDFRQTMVVPGPQDSRAEICYRLRNRNIPTQHPYRFLLNAAVMDRLLDQERPDLIEIGSPLLVPWVVRRANRRHRIPMVWFFHSNVPRVGGAGRHASWGEGLHDTTRLAVSRGNRRIRDRSPRPRVLWCRAGHAGPTRG
jgi:hypothetical protein